MSALAGRRTQLVTGAAAALTLALAVTIAYLWFVKPSDHGQGSLRSQVTATARQRVPLILSYSYRTIDADITRAGQQLTGDFKSKYSDLLTSQVKPGATSGQVTTKATVVGVGVVSASRTKAVLLAFLDLNTVSGKKQTPQLNGSRVEVTLSKVGNRWLISDLAPV